ncbi:MAG: indole-3-glycerol phosphate synthase TrpC [Pseudomonadota bacterium]
MSALHPILAAKRAHVAARRKAVSLAELEACARDLPPPRRFAAALFKARQAGAYGLVCEIKRASPSKGLIRADFDPAALAHAYAEGGARCLSVLTDTPFFMGEDSHLNAVRTAAPLPLLRKDFMIDPYQIVESRALGADCVLLIMAALDDVLAGELEAAVIELSLDALIEVHDMRELERAMKLKSPLIGINNRNLRAMTVDLEVSLRLAPQVPKDRLVVGESGLATRADLERLAAAGITSFLIGEALMRAEDVTKATKALLEKAA